MIEYSKLKILVVEDELPIRKIIKTILSAMGIQNISEAPNGREGYEILKSTRLSTGEARRRFDLIVCDWMMPQMSGIELLEKVRTDPILKATPFLLVTAQNEIEPVMQAISSGADDYIVKPFTATILESKVREILERASG